ncbi:MAG: hypothetical protein DDT32_02316 [Syntrophomonadaceae bacterium]|nr:hypothetical protein [Bacillota bacterium]
MKADADLENAKITPNQVNEVAVGKSITIKQLADDLSYSTAWISYLVKVGRIAAVKPLGGTWRIPQSEVKRIKEVGLQPLPRKVVAEESAKITVAGEHLGRVKEPEKKETVSKKSGLFEMFFGKGDDDE